MNPEEHVGRDQGAVLMSWLGRHPEALNRRSDDHGLRQPPASMAASAGCSGTPLSRTPGAKPGHRLAPLRITSRDDSMTEATNA